MMKRFSMLLGLCCLLLAGCEAASQADCTRDAAAIDFALATMTDSDAPTPPQPEPDKCPRCGGSGWITHGDGHRTPCPDCQDGSAGPYGGLLDTLRQAKELIRKGNDLADRGKALLDAAEREGKVTVDIRLPGGTLPVLGDETPAGDQAACPSGICPYVLSPSADPQAPREATEDAESVSWTYFHRVRRPRLFWRFRR